MSSTSKRQTRAATPVYTDDEGMYAKLAVKRVDINLIYWQHIMKATSLPANTTKEESVIMLIMFYVVKRTAKS